MWRHLRDGYGLERSQAYLQAHSMPCLHLMKHQRGWNAAMVASQCLVPLNRPPRALLDADASVLEAVSPKRHVYFPLFPGDSE